MVVALVGLLVTAALMARGVAGALLWGILAGAAVAYAVLKTVSGRGPQVHPLLYVFAVLFVIRYAFLRG